MRSAITLPERSDDVPQLIPFNGPAKKVLELTFREALRLGHNYIGTEHILLALLEQEDGDGPLHSAGVDKARAEADITRILAVDGAAPKSDEPSHIHGPPRRLHDVRVRPFEDVVAEHGATVLRVCRAVVGPVDAEDAWSETFLSALRAYPDLPADANVEAWLVTIAHRRAIDVGRARSRRPVPTDTVPDRPAAHADPAARDPDLWAALQRLPTKQRQAVAYHHIAGLPYAEIAELLGNSPDAARRAAADGLKTLRKLYPEGRKAMSNNLFTARGRRRRHAVTACTAASNATPTPTACSTSPTAPSTPRLAPCCWPPPPSGWSGSPTTSKTTPPCWPGWPSR